MFVYSGGGVVRDLNEERTIPVQRSKVLRETRALAHISLRIVGSLCVCVCDPVL